MSGYSDQAAAVAALAKLGIRPNDRVLILLPDGPDFGPAFAGVIHHGAVPLTANSLPPPTTSWLLPPSQEPGSFSPRWTPSMHSPSSTPNHPC